MLLVGPNVQTADCSLQTSNIIYKLKKNLKLKTYFRIANLFEAEDCRTIKMHQH